MNREFVDALNELALARGMDKMQLVGSFEEALKHAYEKNVEQGKNIEVHLNADTGELEVLVIREVVEEVTDQSTQVSLKEAKALDPDVEVGMEMEFPEPPERVSRIAIQTAKQVMTQKMREAERNIVYNEYKDRQGEVITAQVARIDNKSNVFVELGRGEAIMPPREQIQGERLMPGARTKVYLSKIEQGGRGPSILVSRAAPELLQHLMKQEIPEVSDGTVEIKAIAREAGQRSKVAVSSRNSNVDPIGACIGHRGNRIQAVTGEIGRERVDVILWDQNPRDFIRNALSPAKVGSIDVDTEGKQATVSVTGDQLSLAIGKSGQNVRLAARLTGFKIDLKQVTSDLDSALAEAAKEDGDGRGLDRGNEKFDSLFSATPDGETKDLRETEI